MLQKCKICKNYPIDLFIQKDQDGNTILENVYFFIVDKKKICFCSPHCATKYATEKFYTKDAPSVAK